MLWGAYNRTKQTTVIKSLRRNRYLQAKRPENPEVIFQTFGFYGLFELTIFTTSFNNKRS